MTDDTRTMTEDVWSRFETIDGTTPISADTLTRGLTTNTPDGTRSTNG